jgi:pimeloyl-ACP methyl ester carboxylesterase
MPSTDRHKERMMLKKTQLAALVALTLSHPAWANGEIANPVADQVQTLKTHPCTANTMKQAQIEDEGLHCYSFETPVNDKQPEGKKANMVFAFRPADGKPQGTLMINFGGPGGAAAAKLLLTVIQKKEHLNVEILQNFNLIGLDPRGVGQSHFAKAFQTCSNEADSKTNFFDADGVCDMSQLNFLPFINTLTLAKDMEALRSQIGEDKLSFLGYSYGTRVGAVYAAMFPEHLQALILDSPMNARLSTANTWQASKQGLQAQMDYVQQSLNQTYPAASIQAWPKFDEVQIQTLTAWSYEQETLQRALESKTDYNAEYDEIFTYGSDVQKSLLARKLLSIMPLGFLNPENIGLDQIATVISLMTNLNHEQAEQLTQQIPKNNLHSLTFAAAVLCGDRSASDVVFDQAHQSMCAGYPELHAQGIDFASIQTPTLIFGNEYDPNTPLVWYEAMQQAIPHAYAVKIKGSTEHGSIFSGKRFGNDDHHNIDQIATDFLLAHHGDASANFDLTSGQELEVDHKHIIEEFSESKTNQEAHAKYLADIKDIWQAMFKKLTQAKQEANAAE